MVLGVKEGYNERVGVKTASKEKMKSGGLCIDPCDIGPSMGKKGGRLK